MEKMSSILDKLLVPQMPSPLANSTKIANNANGDGLYRTSISRQSISEPPTKATTSTTATESIPVTHISSINISISCANSININNKVSSNAKSSRRSTYSKKPVTGRKVTNQIPTEPIKAIAYNCNNKDVTVEKILKQINMSKYQQSFKKIDVAKFKELREIDLNAIGITRPAEIKTLMQAIKKTKSDFY